MLQLAIHDTTELTGFAIHAPIRCRWPLAQLELIFLHIHTEFDERALTAVNDKAGHGGRYQTATMQNNPQSTVTQHHMEVVISKGTGALPGKVCLQPVRLAEQLQRLIQHMGAEIEPESGTRATRFAPALAHFGAIAIEVRLELGDLPQCPLGNQTAHGKEIPVPTAVVEDAEQLLLLFGQLDQLCRFGQIQRKRLVDDDVLACQQRLAGEGGMGIVGGGDHHQIDGVIAQHFFQ